MNISSSYNYNKESPSTSRRIDAYSVNALTANISCVQSFRRILHSKDPIGCLVKSTRFNAREIKLIYRNFKQVCLLEIQFHPFRSQKTSLVMFEITLDVQHCPLSL